MLHAIRYLVKEIQKISNEIGACWYPQDKQLVFYYHGIVIGNFVFKNSSEVYEKIPNIVKMIKRRLIVLKAPSLSYGLEKTWKITRFRPGFKRGEIINGERRK